MTARNPETTLAPSRRYASFAVDRASLRSAIEHLVRLVDAESISGAEAAAVAEAEAICAELGLETRRLPVGQRRDNLLVGLEPEAPPATARLLLCTHLDTVPPFIGAGRTDDAITGRGAADAKGVAVAMLHGLAAARREGFGRRAACLLVVGEETDHSGAQAALDVGLAPELIVLGEPCGLAPARGQKGLLKLRLTAHGFAAHSAYPECGVSATERMIEAICAVRSAPLPADLSLGATTVNIGRIEGGLAANVIAPRAEALLLLRCGAPVDAVLSAMLDRVGHLVSLEELSRAEPLDFVTFEEEGRTPGPSVPFNTDAHTLEPLGAKMMLMGPGDMRCAHADRERLSFDELRDGIQAFAHVVARSAG